LPKYLRDDLGDVTAALWDVEDEDGGGTFSSQATGRNG